jgi:hypothetical protein
MIKTSCTLLVELRDFLLCHNISCGKVRGEGRTVGCETAAEWLNKVWPKVKAMATVAFLTLMKPLPLYHTFFISSEFIICTSRCVSFYSADLGHELTNTSSSKENIAQRI